MRLAILCPGQGAQHPAMFDLARSDAGVADCMDRWNLPLGADLFANATAQPLVVGASLALWECLRHRIPAPALVAGYSVGEVAALAVAGMLGAPQAVALAANRARFMDACVDPAAPQGLAAVSGVPLPVLRSLLKDGPVSSEARVGVHIAIVNADDQAIVGGMDRDLVSLQPTFDAAGARTQRLPVSVASHTPLMRAAVEPLTRYLGKIVLARPGPQLLAGISGETVVDQPSAMRALTCQIVQTVQWATCMDALNEAGVTTILELGPGNSLSRMLRARYPNIPCRSASDFRSIAGILQWIERMA